MVNYTNVEGPAYYAEVSRKHVNTRIRNSHMLGSAVRATESSVIRSCKKLIV